MILILLKKLEIVFFIIILVLTSFSQIDWNETFYWGVVCSPIVFEVILRIWVHLRKVPTLKFTDETVIVSGVKIHRCDITGWLFSVHRIKVKESDTSRFNSKGRCWVL
jgi:ABC-type enterobactin transport system permease subunit